MPVLFDMRAAHPNLVVSTSQRVPLATTAKRRRPTSRTNGTISVRAGQMVFSLRDISSSVGPRFKGEAFLPSRALREAAPRATRKGAIIKTPRGKSSATAVVTPTSLRSCYSTPALSSSVQSPSILPGPTKRTCLERDFIGPFPIRQQLIVGHRSDTRRFPDFSALSTRRTGYPISHALCRVFPVTSAVSSQQTESARRRISCLGRSTHRYCTVISLNRR